MFWYFWNPLQGALAEHRYTIESCFRLHNLIVNEREELKNGVGTEINDIYDDSELMHHYDAFCNDNPFEPMGIIGDDTRVRGRSNGDDAHERSRSAALRDLLAHRIHLAGVSRPST